MTEGMSLSNINRPAINMNNTEVANNPNDKPSGEEYFDRRRPQQEQEDFRQSPFVDRSAQLRATLNSLAALNAANVVKAKDKYKNKPVEKKPAQPKGIVNPIENKEQEQEQQEETQDK